MYTLIIEKKVYPCFRKPGLLHSSPLQKILPSKLNHTLVSEEVRVLFHHLILALPSCFLGPMVRPQDLHQWNHLVPQDLVCRAKDLPWTILHADVFLNGQAGEIQNMRLVVHILSQRRYMENIMHS